ncbi:CHAT domain-containing protein [Nonomuraea angiospora]|uniref:CHAT domain-containing protein n=1 Tax=Nonomuraea angiospora TaxID=46172 RepID=UPI0029AE0C80|nr:CHAT domain-containing protein [Nonomuraea angiospora]MDX3099405.1 CHAT domain-containing protein [Nonomuraea angiospora]
MPDDPRLAGLMSRVARKGDSDALDAAVRLVAGDPDALDAAVRPVEGEPDPAASVADRLLGLARDAKRSRNVGVAWRERAVRITRDPADLDRAVAALERAPAGDVRVQRELASTLYLRHQAEGEDADLDRARAAAEAALDDPEARAVLATILRQAPRDPADLERAESLLAEAVTRLPRSHEWRPGLLRDLAKLLEDRYARTRDPQALDEAIAAWQRAADAGGRSHAERPHYLTGVGQALRRRYERTGDTADAERSLRVLRRALEAAGPGHRHRADYVSNLGTAYQDRYGFSQERADLDRAIELHEEALAAREDDPGFLANLGNALRLRSMAGSDPADLDRSVELQERALAGRPDGGTPRLLNHFGLTLRLRYLRQDDRADLLSAIGLHERALAATPEEHRDHPLFLANLASDLRLLLAANAGQADGDHADAGRADFDHAVEVHERLAALASPGPDRDNAQAWRAWTLFARYEAFGAESDLAGAAAAMRATGDASSPELTRLAGRIRLHEANVRVHEATAPPGDDRLAFVMSGTHAGRTRHLVIVCEPGAPLVLPPSAERPDAVFFLGAWDQVETDADLLILSKAEDGYLTTGYPLPDGDPPGPEALAAEVLAYTRHPPELRGPYRVEWTDLAAFVISGHFAWGPRRLGVVTSRPGRWIRTAQDEEALVELFHTMTYESGADATSWVNDSPLPLHNRITVPESLPAGGPAALTPSEFGRLVLTMATTYRHGDLTYHWVSPGDLLAHSVQYRADDSEPWTVGELRDWPPGEDAATAKDEAWEWSQQWYAGNYGTDALTAVREDRLIDAFHAFSLHIRLVKPASVEQAMASMHCGDTVLDALLRNGHPDLSAWVAERCAKLAGRFELPTVQREMLREAAIAYEAQGLLDAALRCYDQALDIPADAPADPVERELRGLSVTLRNLHLDYVTTSVSLLADHEPEGLYRDGLDGRAARLVAAARLHLEAAELLVREEPEETSRWARLAVQVYRPRIGDLLGEHAEAVERLDRLIGGQDLAAQPRLLATAHVFRLAALRKLAGLDEVWAARYDACLAEAAAGERQWPGDRACVAEVLRADRLTELGSFGEALSWAVHALNVQLLAEKRRVAVPAPGESHAGWMAIDVPARLNEICHRMGNASEDARMFHRLCFSAVESAKSRWFRRDLLSGLETRPDGSVTYRPMTYPAEEFDELLLRASRLVRRPPAPPERRRRWTIGRGGRARFTADGRRAAGRPAVAEAFPEGHTGDLRRRLPEGAALVSFYLTAEHTYLTCLTPERSLTMRLPIPARALNRAVLALQAGFSGTGLYGRIDPAHPYDLDERLIEPVRALGWHLHPLAPLLRDAPLVLVAPHRAWHNIPIHALVLPLVWETGRCPAWSYVPSLGVAEDLVRRAARRPARTGPAAMLTVPGGEEEHETFLACHRRITGVLGRAATRAEGVFGRDATPEEALSTATRVDLLHTLAHGSHREGAEVMESGLALSGGVLSGSALLSGHLSAAHLTFQACSVGRVVTSMSDDIWGPTRAALLSGADSVLAPMWDVDLESSTRLLETFYTRWLIDGQDKALAFAEAQRDMWRAEGPDAWRHMYHWAAFKLTGV